MNFSKDFDDFINARLMFIEAGEEYKKATDDYRELERTFSQALLPEQHALFDSTINAKNIMLGVAEERAYRRGFTDCMRLLAGL